MKLHKAIRLIEKLLNYMEQDEAKNYEEWISVGGKPSQHIYTTVRELRGYVNFWKQMYQEGLRYILLR